MPRSCRATSGCRRRQKRFGRGQKANIVQNIGAQGGRDINSMTNLQSTYWTNIDSTLEAESLSRLQVQIIWLSSGDIYSFNEAFPQLCYTQIEKYRLVLQTIKTIYPNCRVVYLSDICTLLVNCRKSATKVAFF